MTKQGNVEIGDGCSLAWRMDGPDEGPVLVLSNSLGTSLDMWDSQIEALSSHARVVRYDTRGHGASTVMPGDYGLDRLGRDVLSLLDSLHIKRANFCGLSLGGMVGQWLGVFAPDRVDRLVLANTSAYMGPPNAWQQRMDLVRKDGMSAIADAVLQRWYTPEFLQDQPEAISRTRQWLLDTDANGYAGCCAAIRDMDLRPLSKLISSPTLVIGGSKDPATPPAHAEALADHIPNAELCCLEAAHLSNIECPAAFTSAIAEFIFE